MAHMLKVRVMDDKVVSTSKGVSVLYPHQLYYPQMLPCKHHTLFSSNILPVNHRSEDICVK